MIIFLKTKVWGRGSVMDCMVRVNQMQGLYKYQCIQFFWRRIQLLSDLQRNLNLEKIKTHSCRSDYCWVITSLWNPIYKNLSALVPENASPNFLFIFQAQGSTPKNHLEKSGILLDGAKDKWFCQVWFKPVSEELKVSKRMLTYLK